MPPGYKQRPLVAPSGCCSPGAAASMSVPLSQHRQQQHTGISAHVVSSTCSWSNRRYSMPSRQPWSSSRSCRTAAATLVLLLLLPSLLVRLVDAAAAQPCIECNQCLTASCQRICSNSCKPRRANVVTADQCKSTGEEAADAVADRACREVQAACQAGTKSAMAFASNQPVSPTECASIANGACQRSANSAQNTPCGVYMYFGVRSCNGGQFRDMYKARVVGLCRSATSSRK